MIRCQIVQFVLIILFSTIYTLNQKNCPIFIGDENVVTLTYEKFRDSTDKVVRISDEVEQPISLSSFFITRNKIKQQIYQYNCDLFEDLDECVKKMAQCELDATSHPNCILKDTTRAPVLIYLDISNGHLQNLHSNTFATTSECLQCLVLSDNTIILQSNIFEDLSNLIQLFLNNNAINDVPVNTFYGLISLKTLSLANNNLKSFEFGSFSGLINLETLDLSNNQLNYFDSNKFMNLNNLQILLIDGNPFNNLNLTDLNVKLIKLHTIGLTNMFWTCEKLVKVIIELRKMNIGFKSNSLSNQLNYNIDGINCEPEDYNTTNYFIQARTEESVVINTHVNEENYLRDLINFTNQQKHLSSVLLNNDSSLNQFQYDYSIEYNNETMPPLFSAFLQNINKIITNKTDEIKESLQKLDNTTSLLLNKLEIFEKKDVNKKHEVDGRDEVIRIYDDVEQPITF